MHLEISCAKWRPFCPCGGWINARGNWYLSIPVEGVCNYPIDDARLCTVPVFIKEFIVRYLPMHGSDTAPKSEVQQLQQRFSTLIGVFILNDDVIKWNYFPRYWPFVLVIHRSPVNSPLKGQWRRALMFSLIYAWINGWVSNDEAGDLRRHRAYYDVTVMLNNTFTSEFLGMGDKFRLRVNKSSKPAELSTKVRLNYFTGKY